MAHHGTLTARQERTIVALLAAGTIEEAARMSKVGLRTLHTWLKQPEFSAAYREARAEAVSQCIAQLQRASGKAVQALVDVIEEETTPAQVRVSAAGKILDLAIRGCEFEELKRRIIALEHHNELLYDLAEEAPITSPEYPVHVPPFQGGTGHERTGGTAERGQGVSKS